MSKHDLDKVYCPLCKVLMTRKKMVMYDNHYWQCWDCKITVEILLALAELGGKNEDSK